MKFTITSDPVDQYNGRGVPGRYDAEFSRLTPKNNCIVFEDFSEMEKVAQAMDGSSAPISPEPRSKPPRLTNQMESPVAGWFTHLSFLHRRQRFVVIFRSEDVMTKEEIIKMAREAGINFRPLDDDYCDMVGLDRGTICRVESIGDEEIKRFAALVSAAEREACAKEGWLAASSNCEDRVAAAIRARSNK